MQYILKSSRYVEWLFSSWNTLGVHFYLTKCWMFQVSSYGTPQSTWVLILEKIIEHIWNQPVTFSSNNFFVHSHLLIKHMAIPSYVIIPTEHVEIGRRRRADNWCHRCVQLLGISNFSTIQLPNSFFLKQNMKIPSVLKISHYRMLLRTRSWLILILPIRCMCQSTFFSFLAINL